MQQVSRVEDPPGSWKEGVQTNLHLLSFPSGAIRTVHMSVRFHTDKLAGSQKGTTGQWQLLDPPVAATAEILAPASRIALGGCFLCVLRGQPSVERTWDSRHERNTEAQRCS